MRKSVKFFSFLILLSLTFPVVAQKPDSLKLWTIDGFGSANFNQVSFTNWAAGGDNSISFSLVGYMTAKYAKDRHSWDNLANLNYGMLWTKEFGLRKNDDKIELETKYGYALSKNKEWSLSALANFKSQFAEGFNFPNDSVVVSRFAAPGWLTIAVGIDWKPVDYFSLFVSPASGRILFVRDQNIANLGTYGNDPGVPVIDSTGEVVGYSSLGDKTRFDFGAYLTAKFQKEVVKNVTIVSKLDVFANYTGDTKIANTPDINWETGFLFKINSYLSASLNLHMIYDKDILIPDRDNPELLDDRVQFKQALGVGLTYKFANKDEVKK